MKLDIQLKKDAFRGDKYFIEVPQPSSITKIEAPTKLALMNIVTELWPVVVSISETELDVK